MGQTGLTSNTMVMIQESRSPNPVDFHFDSLPWAPPSCYCRVFCLLFYHRSVKVSLDKFFKKMKD